MSTRITYARKIDPFTGDYVIEDNQIVNEDPIKQAMYLALKTEKGTSADELLGQEFTQMKVIKDDYENKVKRYVEESLKRLTTENKISIISIEIYRQNSRIGIQIEYKDLTKNINGIIKI